MKKVLLLCCSLLCCAQALYAQEWEARNDTPFEKDHGFAFSINNKGYFVTGGGFSDFGTTVSDDFYSYDPANDSWTQLDDFPGAARGFAIGSVWNGKAYFGFGVDGNGNYLDDIWVFDPQSETWTELNSCSCAGRAHPAFVIADNKIHVGLGDNDFGNLNDFWQYDIETDSWSEKEDFPSHQRHHPYHFAIDNQVYVGMGHGDFMEEGNIIYRDLYKYDPQSDSWEEMTEIDGEGRVAGTQFSFNGKGYALSGQGNDHWFMEEGEFWEYDPESDNWTSLTPHPGGSRWAPGSFIIDNYIYIISGTVQDLTVPAQESHINTVYRYFLGEEDNVSIEENTPLSIRITNEAIFIDQQNISRIDIINSLGQVVLSQAQTGTQLNISHLPQGVYFLSATKHDNSVKTLKFIRN